MLEKYLADLPELVRRVKYVLAARGEEALRRLQYGEVTLTGDSLSLQLFYCLEALSYLRQDLPSTRRQVRQLVSYILTLVDLEEVSLAPYNLYQVPVLTETVPVVLQVNEDVLLANESLLQVSTGVLLRQLTLPTPYPEVVTSSCSAS